MRPVGREVRLPLVADNGPEAVLVRHVLDLLQTPVGEVHVVRASGCVSVSLLNLSKVNAMVGIVHTVLETVVGRAMVMIIVMTTVVTSMVTAMTSMMTNVMTAMTSVVTSVMTSVMTTMDCGGPISSVWSS